MLGHLGHQELWIAQVEAGFTLVWTVALFRYRRDNPVRSRRVNLGLGLIAANLLAAGLAVLFAWADHSHPPSISLAYRFAILEALLYCGSVGLWMLAMALLRRR
jgi:hypothetical protein